MIAWLSLFMVMVGEERSPEQAEDSRRQRIWESHRQLLGDIPHLHPVHE